MTIFSNWWFTKNLLILYLFAIAYFKSYSQNEIEKNIFISAGYGLAGSFFVRSYTESLPFPSGYYRAFFKKNFIGSAQNFSIGYRLAHNYEIKTGINFQHFTRRIKARDTLLSVNLYLDKNLHHRDYMYFGTLDRTFDRRKHFFCAGLG